MYNPFRNFGLKFLAVIIAALLWFSVAGEKVVERRIRAPLELQNIPEGLEIVGDTPAAIDVRLRGASGTLAHLAAGDVVAVLDLVGARAGRRIFQLTPEQVQAPFGVEVTHVAPATTTLIFEQSVTRAIAVAPSVEGDPAPGYIVERVTVDPPEVDITGPQSALRGVPQATTEPVSIEGATSTVRESVTIGVPNNALRLKTPRAARVVVEIAPVPAQRTMARVPVRLMNLRARLSALAVPAAVSVTLRGAESIVKTLDTDAVLASVDLAGLGPGQYNLTIHVAPSKAFGVVRIDPAQAQVRIK